MKKIFLILSLSSLLFSFNGLEKYNSDSNTFVKLKSKSSECKVSYYFSTYEFEETNCLNFENSNKVAIFCTKDKKICKTHDEVLFFAISGKDLNQEKISKNPPFIGKKTFNFAGGSGTGEMIKIDSKNHVIVESHGLFGSDTTFEGSYKNLLKEYTLYGEKIICTKEEDGMHCAELYSIEDETTEDKIEEKDTALLADAEKENIEIKSSLKKEEICMSSNMIDADVFRKMNPFKLKNKCVDTFFQIEKVLSEDTAIGYNLLKNYNLNNFQYIGTTKGNRAVYITAKGNLSDSFTDGAEIRGRFKIIGTEKLQLVNGSEITASSLIWIKKIK